jgi:hypothetical protein
MGTHECPIPDSQIAWWAPWCLLSTHSLAHRFQIPASVRDALSLSKQNFMETFHFLL